jgi:mono/diheme cytochrome c family protein
MSSVDLKILAVTLLTIGAYTVVANIIPQVQSDVPAQLAFGADVSPEELVSAGRQLYDGAGGCVACHAESPGARAPNLRTDYQGEGPIGARCGDRVPGLSCKEYLYQALVRPNDFNVGDYPPIMQPLDRTMTQAQIWALVAYLESNGGQVTVTGADIPEATGEEAPGPGAPGMQLATTDPVELIRELCVQCHVMGELGTDLGPGFDDIGARRSAQELRLAILDPPAVVTAGYEDFVGLMPVDFGRRLTAEQLEAMVTYLSQQR